MGITSRCLWVCNSEKVSAAEWAGFAAGITAVLIGFFGGLRYLIKGWLWTLTPNAGSSLADRLARIETRQEEMMRILVDKK
jgi:hypothetical protein